MYLPFLLSVDQNLPTFPCQFTLYVRRSKLL
uniref:Uncharacterized protein n=1 Tax=Rhizophora mucronata TaxID=61149 RepID=A0A2P2NWG6_RHIMU